MATLDGRGYREDSMQTVLVDGGVDAALKLTTIVCWMRREPKPDLTSGTTFVSVFSRQSSFST
jgi:hypothetical protein